MAHNGTEDRRAALGTYIRQTLNGFAVSFTVVAAIRIFLTMCGAADELDAWQMLEILVTCAAVAAVQFLIGLLPIDSVPALLVLYMAAMYAVVFFLGIVVFDFFSGLRSILIWCVFLLLVFLIVLFLSYMGDWNKAKEINRMIQKKKRR